MLPFFPRQIAIRAVFVYVIALFLVSALFFRYSMPFWRMGLGLAFVCGFFLLTAFWSKKWMRYPEKRYIGLIFGIAVSLRVVWVVGSYIFYLNVNGNPFEFDAADSFSYHEIAEDLSPESWSYIWNILFNSGEYSVSDTGYPIYLTILYKCFGANVIIPRLIKCLLSSWMCVLVYRLCSRTFGEHVGRMAGIMCCLMPNLIIYCGYHLKETEMLFLEVAFMERLDSIIRNKEFHFWDVFFPMLLAAFLFFFRTVLGAVAVLSFVSAILFINLPTMKKGGRRIVIFVWSALAVSFVLGTTIISEMELYWEQRNENVVIKRDIQKASGIKWAKYATGTVMAPMIVALPFSTMVVTEGQESQITRHGGNYCRNFMAFFAILAIVEALRQKKWRNFALIGAFTIGYLGIISVTGFSNSERFLLPGLPGLIMMWAYGLSELNEKSYKFMAPWCILVVLMELSWAFFKLGSRGLF